MSIDSSAASVIALPTSAAGVSIAWKSDNAAIAVDNATGKATVTRPAATAADAEVTLTATFGNNAKTAAYTFFNDMNFMLFHAHEARDLAA